MNTPKAGHLPNLDGLRFIAAASVLFSHIDDALTANGYKAKEYTSYPFGVGGIFVVFFFVLSGFLITYLLLHEKEKREISVKSFYLKRVLRIWPLYYLVVLVSVTYFNNQPFFYWKNITDTVAINQHPVASFVMLLLICPNVLLLNSKSLGYANPTWSIGVEEQFYLIWPWIMKAKRPLIYILTIILIVHLLSNNIIGSFLTSAVGKAWFPATSVFTKALQIVSRFFTFWASFRIDAMAIGALGAFAVYKNSWWLTYLFSKPFQLVLYCVTALLLLFPEIASYQFYSVIFLLVIINMAVNKDTIFSLNNKVLNYLGKISYGIYMYHCLTIMPAIYIVTKILGWQINLFSEVATCITSLLITIAVASLSFRYFESFFLRMKKVLA